MNKHISALTFLVFSLTSYITHSQNHRDIFKEKYAISIDSAEVYSHQLISSEKANIRAFGYAAKGHINTMQGDYSFAEDSFILSFKELNYINDDEVRLLEKLYILYYYSNLLVTQHKLELAIKEINEGLKLSKKLEKILMQISYSNMIGRCYSLLGLDNKALEIGRNTIYDINNSKKKINSNSYNNILLSIYLNTTNRALASFSRDSIKNKTYIDSTIKYFNRTKSFINTNNIKLSTGRKRAISILNADISFYSKKYEKALKLYKEALEFVRLEKSKKRIYQLNYKIAECYFYLEKYEKAQKLFEKLDKEYLNSFNLLKNKISIKYYYAEIFLKLGDADKALKYAKSFNDEYKRYNDEIKDLSIDIFTKNELDTKKAILDDLKAQEEVNKRLSQFLIAGGVFILVGFFVTIIFLKRQRKKFSHKIETLLGYIKTLESNTEKPFKKKITEQKAKIILDKLKEIESENLFTNKDYSLSGVAKIINSNSSYVSKVVNEYWGKSFVDYTNELRINYILLKLREEKIYQKFTLVAIAESAGYKSLSSFNKHFKNISGVTPKQYLNYLKKKSHSTLR